MNVNEFIEVIWKDACFGSDGRQHVDTKRENFNVFGWINFTQHRMSRIIDGPVDDEIN